MPVFEKLAISEKKVERKFSHQKETHVMFVQSFIKKIIVNSKTIQVDLLKTK